MDFGLFMMPLHPPHRSFADSYDRDLDLIVLADKLGFREAWIGEHTTERWENVPAPDLLIAKALAMTEHIILGTGVTLLATHNPVQLAHRIAMLDHLARGRFYWGIGSGGLSTDLELFGLDPKQRSEIRERADEALDVVLKMWENDGKFDYHGKYFDISAPELDPIMERGLYMKPYQTPHPPIGVAAISVASDSMRLAGQRGWIPMSSSNLLPSTSRDTGRLWPRAPLTLVLPLTASSGTSTARFSWPKPTSWPGSGPGRFWDEITWSTRCPTGRTLD